MDWESEKCSVRSDFPGDLPPDLARTLRRAGITNWWELVAWTPERLCGLSGIGDRSIQKMRKALERRGLELKHDQKGFMPTLQAKFRVIGRMIELEQWAEARALAANSYPELCHMMRVNGAEAADIPLPEQVPLKYYFELVANRQVSPAMLAEARAAIKRWQDSRQNESLLLCVPPGVEVKAYSAGRKPEQLPEVRVLHMQGGIDMAEGVTAEDLRPALEDLQTIAVDLGGRRMHAMADRVMYVARKIGKVLTRKGQKTAVQKFKMLGQ